MSHEWENTRLDAIFRALSDPVRRHVLYYLQVHEDATVDELATAITGWRGARSIGGSTEPHDRDQMVASLYHTHLPKLADSGVVRYDREDGRVELGDIPPFVTSLLDVASHEELDVERPTFETVTDVED